MSDYIGVVFGGMQIQGSILLASLFEVGVGLTGLMGLALRYIGPLAIAPTITLVGVSLFGVASQLASQNWLAAIVSVPCWFCFLGVFSIKWM